MSTLKRLSKNLITAVLSLVFVFQYAFAFDPSASVEWHKQGQYPYNWAYTGTIYVNYNAPEWKGDISAYAVAYDVIGEEIAGTMSERIMTNASMMTLGHAVSSSYNTTYLAARIYGVVTAGTLKQSVRASNTNGIPGIKTRNMSLYSQILNAIALRDESLIKSFDANISATEKYALFDYLNMNWEK